MDLANFFYGLACIVFSIIGFIWTSRAPDPNKDEYLSGIGTGIGSIVILIIGIILIVKAL